jgi:hypothetical protein
MVKINIKCAFPANWYQLRSLKLKFEDGTIVRIAPGQDRKIEFEKMPSSVSARIDFLSQHITIDTKDEEAFVVLGMRGNSMLKWTLNGFNPNGLLLEQVNLETYNAFGKAHYIEKGKAVKQIDRFTFFLVSLISVGMIYQGIQFGVIQPNLSEFLYASSFIGFATIFRLYFKRTFTQGWLYISYMGTISLLMVISIIWAGKYGLTLSWLWIQLPVLICLRSVMFVKKGNGAHQLVG